MLTQQQLRHKTIIKDKKRVLDAEVFDGFRSNRYQFSASDSNEVKYSKILLNLILDGYYFSGIDKYVLNFIKGGCRTGFKNRFFWGRKHNYLIVNENLRLEISQCTADHFVYLATEFNNKNFNFSPGFLGVKQLLKEYSVNKFIKKAQLFQRFECSIEELTILNKMVYSNSNFVKQKKLSQLKVNRQLLDDYLTDKELPIPKDVFDFFMREEFAGIYDLILIYIIENADSFDLAINFGEVDESAAYIAKFSTYNGFKQLLRKHFKGLAKKLPNVDKVKTNKDKTLYTNDFLNEDQVEKLMETENDELFIFYLFSIYFGFRPGTVLSQNFNFRKSSDGEWFIDYITVKTGQKLSKKLQLFLPENYYIRLRNITDGFSRCPKINLSADKIRKHFYGFEFGVRLYTLRKTFVNHLAISLAQFQNNSFFDSYSTIFRHCELPDLISSSNESNHKIDLLTNISHIIGELLGHSSKSTVLIHHYLSGDFVFFLNPKEAKIESVL